MIYDFESERVLASAKALTTKDDLCVGILNALDGLPAELFGQTRILSLSTTLAANACVEGKGGAAMGSVYASSEAEISAGTLESGDCVLVRAYPIKAPPAAQCLLTKRARVWYNRTRNISKKAWFCG